MRLVSQRMGEQLSRYDMGQSHLSRFHMLPGNTDYHAPKIVTVQTHALLQLFRSNSIHNPEYAHDYLQECTLPFLTAAAKGVQRVFFKDRLVMNDQSFSDNESADFAAVVFAWMHAYASSPALPMGYSRRGMLRAPETDMEFVNRITEIKKEIVLFISGLRDSSAIHFGNPSALRMITFFDVGSQIPLHFPDDGKEQQERQEEQRRRRRESDISDFNALLGTLSIDLE